MNTSPITFERTCHGFPIMTNPDKNWGCYTDIVYKILERLLRALNIYSQILIIRFDVRFPHAEEFKNITDNAIFQGFIENYRRYLQRHGFDPMYIWCAEQGYNSSRLHYHVAFILNGNNIRRMPTLKKAEELWFRAIGMPVDSPGQLIHRCYPTQGTRLFFTQSGIRRGDRRTLDEAVYWLSYLAKVNTKGVPHGVRTFGCSMLPKEPY